MAVDNLNYYSSGLPAGQQTDKYTSQPGCLKSKNLDIFSSSKSVKATAWSEPENTDEGGVVLVDQTGDLILKSDGNVYDRSSGSEVLVYSGVATNFPSYNISYNGRFGTYAPAEWGDEKQLISKYENGVLKYFTIFTDKSRLSYSTLKYSIQNSDITFYSNSGWTVVDSNNVFHKSGSAKDTTITLGVSNLQGFANAVLTIQADNLDYATEGHIQISSIKLTKQKYWYNDETEDIQRNIGDGSLDITVTDQPDEATSKVSRNVIPVIPDTGMATISIKLTVVPPEGSTTYTWSSGELIIGFEGYDAYYNYLGVNDNRYLEDVGEYYWEKGLANQTLYAWSGEWANTDTWQRVVRYYLEKYMAWANDVSMDVISMIAWNEQIYMIGNMNGNGYIFPCDLSGGRGTPYIAYGCTFKGATNIDYLLYLVGEDRGVSTLWVFNQQELVPLVGGNKESGITDLVDPDEQYNFDGKIVNYRKNLILTTSDGRIFRYGQTYGGKGGTFIHDLKPSEHDSLTIDSVKAYGNDLIINYTVVDTIEGSSVTTHWTIIYQDDIAEKNYNTEWSATYPIVLGNHLLEKEESDLYASYILPSADTSLEFWGMANHYHFWTFTSEDDATLDPAESYKIVGATGDYALKFVERNENQYTFRLEGDLPLQTTNEMKVTDSEDTVVINYSDFNHFRKIGEITTDKYCEGEFRFHNLNNQLELPKSHSLQIMVKGKGTVNYTPELFALDLVANQRDRG